MRGRPHRQVLELGSTAWTLFLEGNGIAPDELTCINISERELAQGMAAAAPLRLQPRFEIMDAHNLTFPDDSLDVVFGVSILHHLDVEVALSEIRRVLRPDGIMIFAEPLDMNPIARGIRMLTPQARTKDEKPFRRAELNLLRRYFDCEFHFEQLFSVPLGLMAGILFKHEDNPLTRLGYRLDEFVQRTAPGLGQFYRHTLIVGRPRAEVRAEGR